MKVLIGVDCGATNLRVGIVSEEGCLLASSKTPSPLKVKPEDFAGLVRQETEHLVFSLKEHHLTVEGLGVGTPGPLDLKKGIILPSSNLGNRESIDLKIQFEREFNVKTYFDRDTDIALLGEVWQGAAVGKKEVVMLTLGSGVGGAILVNGEIDRGASGKAGEIGHMIIESQKSRQRQGSPASPRRRVEAGPRAAKIKSQKCGLGHEGCLEALINAASNLEELGTYLGYGLANIVDIFNPETIIIGGGKINWGDFLPKATQVMKEVGMSPAATEVKVVYAKLKEWSGVYGGAALAMQTVSSG